ncbi:MAG: DUF3035 domain-containing protein [Pseudomonadota bacterium]
MDDKPGRAPRGRRVRAAVAACTLAVVLAGCERIGDPLEAMGVRPPAPDEFMIAKRDPLVVPPGVAGTTPAPLPRPTPGAPSPLNPVPQADAIAALRGAGVPAAGAGVAGTGFAAAPVSAGEAALIGAAASARDPSIRDTLVAEARAAEVAEAEGPYQPPTVLELLSLSDEDEEAPDPETLIDPVAESQRLQREGVRTPNDPTAVAELEEEAEAPPALPAVGRDRKRPDVTLTPDFTNTFTLTEEQRRQALE